MAEQIDCGTHGMQPLTFACIHICEGLISGTTPGFVCYPELGEAYPMSWCEGCETTTEALGDRWSEEASTRAQFKMLCARCYLEARDLARDADRLRIH